LAPKRLTGNLEKIAEHGRGDSPMWRAVLAVVTW